MGARNLRGAACIPDTHCASLKEGGFLLPAWCLLSSICSVCLQLGEGRARGVLRGWGVVSSCHWRGEMALPPQNFNHLRGRVSEEQIPMLTWEARFWSGLSCTRLTDALESPDFPLGIPRTSTFFCPRPNKVGLC